MSTINRFLYFKIYEDTIQSEWFMELPGNKKGKDTMADKLKI